MTSQASTPGSNFTNQSPAFNYTPGWVDRFAGWVDQLPMPAWGFYLGLGLVLFTVEILIQWQAGSYPVGSFEPFHSVFPLIAAYFLWLMHYLDKKAATAFDEFRPALDTNQPAMVAQLRYELTTLPARPTWLVSLAGILFAGLTLLNAPMSEQLRMANFALSPPSIVFNFFLYLFNWCITAVVLYHIIHQLRSVNHIYQHTRIDLFQMGPLYTFSDLSARAAIGVGLGMYLGGLVPEFDQFVIWTVVRLSVAAVIVLMFIWPLLGVHQLLLREKDQMLGKNALQFKATFSELHRRLESKDVREIEVWTKAIDGLESEKKTLERISTWPWQPETPRAVLAAVLIPVVIWLIQWVLERFLGP